MTDTVPSLAPELMFNPFEPGFLDDPYPQYARLRAGAPVQETPFGPWVLFRYEDTFALLRDSSTSVEEAKATPTDRSTLLAEMSDRQPQRGDGSILNLDPPDHTRIRRLVAKEFTPRRVEQLRARVQVLVDEALDRLEAAGGGELVSELAFPLPFTVIAELLGVPTADRMQLREWSHTAVKSLDPVVTPDDVRAAIEAGEAMRAYLDDVIATKRRTPGDDLLSALVAVEEDGDRLSSEELHELTALLFIAGHETTVNLIANGTLALLRSRDQYDALAADPGLAANATDELLRYDSPVQLSRRIMLTPTEIGGVAIPAGAFVLVCLGSANRDPQQWGPDADRVDVRRADAGAHVSFGSGIHHCLGAALARMEGQVVFATLLSRFPRMQLAGEPIGNQRIVLRGLDALPVQMS